MLHDPAFFDDDDVICEVTSIVWVMRHEDRHRAHGVEVTRDLRSHVSTSHDVQRCKWLIEEEEIRAIDERTCERNSLRLPSTQLPGMIVCEMCQTETVEIIRRQFASISSRATMRSGTEGNVVEDGFVSEEQMILEDETDISFADGDEH